MQNEPEKQTFPERQYFFGQLLTPRSTFPGDMTETERAAMMQHGQYVRAQIAAGKILVAGPVNDPAGSWGLAVFCVSGLDEVESIAHNDPVVLANLGFSYRILPMFSALTP